jgi:hypothetical protein
VRRLEPSARQARMITLLVRQQRRPRFQALNKALQGHSSPHENFQRVTIRSHATAEHVKLPAALGMPFTRHPQGRRECVLPDARV